jgi:ATP-dependent protease ClpP protease subunit
VPNWKNLLDEVNLLGSTHDQIRKKYLENLSKLTGRNVIVYYSGWLQKSDLYKQGISGFEINDADKNGFMAVVNGLDKTKGLDLILHTPGGDIAATESLVYYLRKIFNGDMRAIVPQIAMSAGTMIALACNEIVMGLHSNLGPIDPQYSGLPAHGIIEEYKRALEEIQKNQSAIPLWQMIFSKYPPTLIGQCQNAIEWAGQIVTDWLKTGMFKNEGNRDELAQKVVSSLGSHSYTKTHARHISPDFAQELGIKIVRLEDDNDLQEAVLSVHHACIYTLSDTNAKKIIENHNGISYIDRLEKL